VEERKTATGRANDSQQITVKRAGREGGKTGIMKRGERRAQKGKIVGSQVTSRDDRAVATVWKGGASCGIRHGLATTKLE